ncbi:MAG: bifunctional phosphoribosylaminoimidazolecarboxamide formyltransferase/IMP cyclohydrolase [Candidatus Omnitrophica bacterium 4484_70.1]|nr:MAG: bifunctional phosphoribosylaminoimidazolecarboxamide formyltransferase/IMP cyclohydrolase [Candidatus Omnitrophica bacterium 4484_70.1]
MLKIRRVLISVWDKKGIIEFARSLKKLNIEIISTGKTATLLKRSGIKVTRVSQLTSFPEILSGRVKTLHPKIFGAVLANKRHPLHIEELRNLEITPIDMIVVNFYPFKQMLKESLGLDRMLEYIDIGGPALLRAGAKNFKNVACVSRPSQYKKIIEELEKNKGSLSEDTLKELAVEVFRLTKEYDTYIYNFLIGREVIIWELEKLLNLRYGENPHQKAGLYRLINNSFLPFRQLQGKTLSFNNFLDLDTALNLAREFDMPSAVIVKHNSPCGVAVEKRLHLAFMKAHKADPLSSFGGIVGLNRKVDGKAAREIIKSDFKECIIAPGYSKEALKMFSQRKNLRVVQVDFSTEIGLQDIKKTVFGYLIQREEEREEKWQVVTKKKPTPREWEDLRFAWQVVKYVKSNGIVVAKNKMTLGVGGGQPSRIGAVKIALRKAKKGAVLASDGFFPFSDSVKLAKKYGIKAIIQPGGSIRDEEVIKACNDYKISMVFTHKRIFRH